MIPLPFPLPANAIYAIAAVVIFGAGYTVSSWRSTAAAEQLESARMAQASKDREEAINAYIHLSGVLAKQRDENAKQQQDARNETNRLRDRLNSGSVGLRIAARCPAVAGTSNAAGAGVGLGAWAELDPASRQAYFDLRDGINETESKLSACQAELKLRTQ